MPRKCKIEREDKLVRQMRPAKREALKKIINDPESSVEEVTQSVDKLDALPVNQSPCRHVRRCAQCGRQRAVYRRFNLCRMCIRNFMNLRYLPGVVKSSW